MLWESGNYGKDLSKETSNYREASNLITRLEQMEKAGELSDLEVFTFTDDAMFEGTFYQGHLDSPKLNDLILHLRGIERRTGCLLHMIHISGTCMKEAGMDGLSRCDSWKG